MTTHPSTTLSLPGDLSGKGVYLIHFEPSYRHACHYLGWAEDIERRFGEHRKGTGARLTQVAVDAGCSLVLVRVWPGADRTTERRLKRWHGSVQLCPICADKR